MATNKTIYLDIMIGGKFFRQVKYQYSPIFKFNIEEMANYVLDKYPSLKKEKHVEIAVGGNRVSTKIYNSRNYGAKVRK